MKDYTAQEKDYTAQETVYITRDDHDGLLLWEGEEPTRDEDAGMWSGNGYAYEPQDGLRCLLAPWIDAARWETEPIAIRLTAAPLNNPSRETTESEKNEAIE